MLSHRDEIGVLTCWTSLAVSSILVATQPRQLRLWSTPISSSPASHALDVSSQSTVSLRALPQIALEHILTAHQMPSMRQGRVLDGTRESIGQRTVI